MNPITFAPVAILCTCRAIAAKPGVNAEIIGSRAADPGDGPSHTSTVAAGVNEVPRECVAASETICGTTRGRNRNYRPMRLLLSAAAFLLTALPASAQSQMTSDQLARLCQIKSPSCADYLSGAYDGAMEAARLGGDRLICPRSKPKTAQLIGYFMMLNILDDGKNGDLTAVEKAIMAFKYAMPCHAIQDSPISVGLDKASIPHPPGIADRTRTDSIKPQT